MKPNVILEKSYAFSIRVTKAYKYLRANKTNHSISDQFLRCGTAIGALVHEAQYAQSHKDFINKMSVALKETNETVYWIKLFYDSEFISETAFKSIHKDCTELLSLLVSIINTAKTKDTVQNGAE